MLHASLYPPQPLQFWFWFLFCSRGEAKCWYSVPGSQASAFEKVGIGFLLYLYTITFFKSFYWLFYSVTSSNLALLGLKISRRTTKFILLHLHAHCNCGCMWCVCMTKKWHFIFFITKNLGRGNSFKWINIHSSKSCYFLI